MLNINGFNAWIVVDGEPLKAYDVEVNQEQKLATCWIPSTVGKAFSVVWKDRNRARLLASSGQLTVDGMKCGGKIVFPGDGESTEVKMDGMNLGPTSLRPFKFSTLELTDDDAYLDFDASQSLGEITLIIRHGYTGDQKETWSTQAPEEGIVHERSKKAVSHRVKLGAETECNPVKQCNFQEINPPVATFTFKYRSMDTLMAMDIAPKLAKAQAKSSRR